MARHIFAFLMFILPGLASAATVQDAVRAACKTDAMAMCKFTMPGKGVMNCLIKNKDKLSTGCAQALSTASCQPKAPDALKTAFACAK